MSLQQPCAQFSSIFDAQESVIQSHPLLAEAPVPQFGNTSSGTSTASSAARLACPLRLDAGVLPNWPSLYGICWPARSA